MERTIIITGTSITIAILLFVGCSRQKLVHPKNTHMPSATESAQIPVEIVSLVGIHREIKGVISHCVEDETTGKRVLLGGEKISPIPDGKRIKVKGYMRKVYWRSEGLSPFFAQWVEYLHVLEVEIIE